VSLLRVAPRKSRRIICASLHSFQTLYHHLRAHLRVSPVLYSHPHFRKHAIENTEMLDFLKELVEGVPDPSAGGKIPLDQPGDNEQTSSRRKGKKAAAHNVDDGDEDGSRPPTKRRRRKKKEEVREAEEGGAPNGDREEAMQDVAPPNRRDENWDMDDESGGY
jgi:Dr1-associated corepressor